MLPNPYSAATVQGATVSATPESGDELLARLRAMMHRAPTSGTGPDTRLRGLESNLSSAATVRGETVRGEATADRGAQVTPDRAIEEYEAGSSAS